MPKWWSLAHNTLWKPNYLYCKYKCLAIIHVPPILTVNYYYKYMCVCVSHSVSVVSLRPLYLMAAAAAVCAAVPIITGTRRPGDHTACAGPSNPLPASWLIFWLSIIYYKPFAHHLLIITPTFANVSKLVIHTHISLNILCLLLWEITLVT
jgi:hypothetical protein